MYIIYIKYKYTNETLLLTDAYIHSNKRNVNTFREIMILGNSNFKTFSDVNLFCLRSVLDYLPK